MANGEEASSRWVRRARGAHRGMGEGPEAAGSPGERWGMRTMILMTSLQSPKMWTVTSFPGDHLRIDKKKKFYVERGKLQSSDPSNALGPKWFFLLVDGEKNLK